MDDGNPMGTPEAEVTWQVDVTAYLAQRRAALSCHASQTTDVGGMLSIPEEVFAGFFDRALHRAGPPHRDAAGLVPRPPDGLWAREGGDIIAA